MARPLVLGLAAALAFAAASQAAANESHDRYGPPPGHVQGWDDRHGPPSDHPAFGPPQSECCCPCAWQEVHLSDGGDYGGGVGPIPGYWGGGGGGGFVFADAGASASASASASVNLRVSIRPRIVHRPHRPQRPHHGGHHGRRKGGHGGGRH